MGYVMANEAALFLCMNTCAVDHHFRGLRRTFVDICWPGLNTSDSR